MAFLNEEGVSHLWDQIITRLNSYVPTESGKGLSANDYTDEDKAKLDALSTDAEANQNTFSYIAAGGETIAADSKTDTVTFLAGANITITSDVENDTITISAAAGSGSGDVSYDLATETTAGLMSAADKVKLNGITANAQANQNAFSNVTIGTDTIVAGSETDSLELVAGDNITISTDATNKKITIASTATRGDTNYTLPVATDTVLGGIKSGTDITVDDSGNVSVNDDSHNHVISNIDGLQEKLDEIQTNVSNNQTSIEAAQSNVTALDTRVASVETGLDSKLDNAPGVITTELIGSNVVTIDKIAEGTLSAVYTATITTTWENAQAPFTQTVSVPGILASDKPIIGVKYSDDYVTAAAELEAWACVYRITTSADSITVYASSTTSTPVNIQLVVLHGQADASSGGSGTGDSIIQNIVLPDGTTKTGLATDAVKSDILVGKELQIWDSTYDIKAVSATSDEVSVDSTTTNINSGTTTITSGTTNINSTTTNVNATTASISAIDSITVSSAQTNVNSIIVLDSSMYGNDDLTTKSGVEGQLYFKVVE